MDEDICCLDCKHFKFDINNEKEDNYCELKNHKLLYDENIFGVLELNGICLDFDELE